MAAAAAARRGRVEFAISRDHRRVRSRHGGHYERTIFRIWRRRGTILPAREVYRKTVFGHRRRAVIVFPYTVHRSHASLGSAAHKEGTGTTGLCFFFLSLSLSFPTLCACPEGKKKENRKNDGDRFVCHR